jgi:hypothetical protein
MITLTTPPTIATQLGAVSSASYAKLRIMEILADPVTQAVTASIQLIDTGNANLPMLTGSLTIVTQGNSPMVSISVPALNLSSDQPLTAAQQTTVQGWITALQNNIERKHSYYSRFFRCLRWAEDNKVWGQGQVCQRRVEAGLSAR